LVDDAPLGPPIHAPGPYSVLWNAAGAAPGPHIVKAGAADVAGNTATSAPVTVTVPAPSPTVVQQGLWSGPFDWSPLVAVHMTLTPTGTVLIWDGEEEGLLSARLWDPSSGLFADVPNSANLFCSAHVVLPDGRVFVAGGHQADFIGIPDAKIFSRVLDLNAQTWTPIGTAALDGGSSVMYQPGKIMKSGLGRSPGFSTAPSVTTTYVLDMTQTSPAWRQTASMAFARNQHNL